MAQGTETQLHEKGQRRMARLANYKPGEIVEVSWLDISSDNEWLSDEKIQSYQPESCVSVGYFQNRDKEVIRISDTIIPKTKHGSVLVIPLGCVKKIRRIR